MLFMMSDFRLQSKIRHHNSKWGGRDSNPLTRKGRGLQPRAARHLRGLPKNISDARLQIASRRSESDREPIVYKTIALPIELRRRHFRFALPLPLFRLRKFDVNE